MKKTVIRTVIVTALALSFSGCTAFGVYMGRRVDVTNARHDIHVTWQHPDSIPKQFPVDVTLRNGKTLSGIYAGRITLPDSIYAPEYAAARAELAISLPPLNEVLQITRKSGRQQHAIFAGFNAEAMLLRDSQSPPLKRMFCSDIDTLEDAAGHGYSPRAIQSLMEQRLVPVRTAIRIRWNGSPITVPLNDVQEIHSGPVRTNNWAFGLALGIITDALVAGTIIRAMNE